MIQQQSTPNSANTGMRMEADEEKPEQLSEHEHQGEAVEPQTHLVLIKKTPLRKILQGPAFADGIPYFMQPLLHRFRGHTSHGPPLPIKDAEQKLASGFLCDSWRLASEQLNTSAFYGLTVAQGEQTILLQELLSLVPVFTRASLGEDSERQLALLGMMKDIIVSLGIIADVEAKARSEYERVPV
ncbi:hypothetical protein BC835DRAFT_1424617 [Cytidiella melzeri]|nr:hypothetical protein BC835DRAFT_1424617 [Cytidiella melzeri]